MKTIKAFSAILLLGLFFATTAFRYESNPPGSCTCDNAILSGCVGACGVPFTASYTVQQSDVNGPNGQARLCFSQTGSSLCPNTTAVYRVTVNNRVVVNGTMATGDCDGFIARVGDVVTVEANLGQGNPNIVCIWLGEAYFSLGHQQ